MIYSSRFNVEGSLYGSEVSLFYGCRRVITVDFVQANRTSYNSARRELYRLRDRILAQVDELEYLGFIVTDTVSE